MDDKNQEKFTWRRTGFIYKSTITEEQLKKAEPTTFDINGTPDQIIEHEIVSISHMLSVSISKGDSEKELQIYCELCSKFGIKMEVIPENERKPFFIKKYHNSPDITDEILEKIVGTNKATVTVVK